MSQAQEKVAVGDRFGKLVVLGEGEPTKWYKTVRCRCDCGREKDIRPGYLIRGEVKSCAKCPRTHSEETRERMRGIPKGRTFLPPINIGDRFGTLVISGPPEMREHSTGRFRPFWPMRCDCGAEYVVSADKIKSGEKRSCYGCQPRPANRKERTEAERAAMSERSKTHGMTDTPEFRAWHGMIARCTYTTLNKAKHYVERGISVCDRWRHGEDGKGGFECFYEDMGNRPSDEHSLDRYPDQNGGYYKGNCRWATITEQNRNRRTTAMVETADGRVPLASVTGDAVVSHQLVQIRMKRLGWSLERAMNTPSNGNWKGRQAL